MKKNPPKIRRDWLNPLRHEDTGAIAHYLRVLPGDDDSRPSLQGSLTLRDCSRQVELDFHCYTAKACRERLRKLDLIRAHLDTIEQEVRAAQQAIAQYKPPAKKDRRGKKQVQRTYSTASVLDLLDLR